MNQLSEIFTMIGVGILLMAAVWLFDKIRSKLGE